MRQLFWRLNILLVMLQAASNAVSLATPATPANKSGATGSTVVAAGQSAAAEKKLPDIILKFADRGEIGLVSIIDDGAPFCDEHPPLRRPQKAIGRVVIPGGSRLSFKSRDMMGLLSMSQVLPSLPADSIFCLDLSNTLVSDDDLKLLSRFHNLRRLDLDNTDISDEGMKHLAGMASLEALNLNKTRCSGKYLSALAGLKNLKFIRIGKSDIDHSALADLGAFKKLIWLDMAQIKLRNDDMGILKNFPDLQKLFVDDNPLLSDKMLPNIAGLKHLNSISFKDTQITARGLSTCKGLPLKYVRFNAEQINSKGRKELQANFPKASLVVEEFKTKAYNLYRELTE